MVGEKIIKYQIRTVWCIYISFKHIDIYKMDTKDFLHSITPARKYVKITINTNTCLGTNMGNLRCSLKQKK